MRVIAGALKSRKIAFPKSKLTRPMTDRSKEMVFNIVGSLVPGKHILDLFAGSGSLGLEALSRGALDVVFVDHGGWAISTIQKNVELLELKRKARIVNGDVLRVIGKLEKEDAKFSLIFVDPPYDQGLVKKTLMRLDRSAIVAPFAQIIVGHSKREELPNSLQSLSLTRTKTVGQSCFSFLFRLDSKDEETKSYISGEF